MKLILLRTFYGPKHTDGVLLLNDNWFAWTVEDRTRSPDEPKVPKQTAIPSGKYKVTVTFSNRFKKPLPLIHNVPNFEGVRFHAGNTSEDSEGCILVAANKIKSGHIQGSKSKELTELLMGKEHELEIIDTGAKYYHET